MFLRITLTLLFVLSVSQTAALAQGSPDGPPGTSTHPLAGAVKGDVAKFSVRTELGGQSQVSTLWRIVGDTQRGVSVDVHLLTMAGEQKRQWAPAGNAPGVQASGARVPLNQPFVFYPVIPGVPAQSSEPVDETITVGGRTYKTKRTTHTLSGMAGAQKVEIESTQWISDSVPLGGLVKLVETRTAPQPMTQVTELLWHQSSRDLEGIRQHLETARVAVATMYNGPQADVKREELYKSMTAMRGARFYLSDSPAFSIQAHGHEAAIAMLAILRGRIGDMPEATALMQLAMMDSTKVDILLNMALALDGAGERGAALQTLQYSLTVLKSMEDRYGQLAIFANPNAMSITIDSDKAQNQLINTQNAWAGSARKIAQFQARFGDLNAARATLTKNRNAFGNESAIGITMVTEATEASKAAKKVADDAAFQRDLESLVGVLATGLYETGRFVEARHVIDSITDANRQMNQLISLAGAMGKAGQADAATAVLDKVAQDASKIDESKNRQFVLQRLANTYSELKQYPKALEQWGKVEQILIKDVDPTSPAAAWDYSSVATGLAEAGDCEGAKRVLALVLTQDTDEKTRQRKTAQLDQATVRYLLATNDLDGAEALVQPHASENDWRDTLVALARKQTEAGQTDQAMGNLGKAHQLVPAEGEYTNMAAARQYETLADAMIAAGHPEAAVAVLDAMVAWLEKMPADLKMDVRTDLFLTAGRANAKCGNASHRVKLNALASQPMDRIYLNIGYADAKIDKLGLDTDYGAIQ